MRVSEYKDLVQRIESLDAHVRRIEQSVRTPMWKRFLYGATIAFLAASAGKYWVRRFDPPQYSLPCITTLDPQYREAQRAR